MEVVSLRASQLTQQLYSSSVRLFASSSTSLQQQHQQLIAFCTLLTVVLLLSFNKHANFLPANLPVVTRCLRCLTYVRRRVTSSTVVRRCSSSIAPLKPLKSYLKLKRLRTTLAVVLPSSTSTYIYYTTSYLLLRPLKKINKMRKETKLRVKNIINIKSGVASRGRTLASVNSSPTLYCPACDAAVSQQQQQDESCYIPTSQSYPVFEAVKHNHIHNHDLNSIGGGGGGEPTTRIHNSKIRLYKKLPLRSMSRAWGEINSIELPTWCRKPCFYFYSWMFSCNLDEIDIDDITHYKNLGEFFRRGLKPDARKIHPSTLVSPCDGKILHFGRVEKGMLEQVKGVNYSLQAFLGERNWPKNAQSASKPKFSSSSFSSGSSSSSSSLSDDDSRSLNDSGMLDPNMSAEEIAAAGELLEKSILYNPDENCLYHCVIYLAPGDYHRFHSPTDWTVFARRHFPGELFSVNPSVARWLQGLFNFNERVVYYGEWEHGFFSMTAVGATNVGSIRVYMDDGLATNTKQKDLKPEDLEKSFVKYDAMTSSFDGVELKKGDNFGEFNLGSTIVLIFEAPKDFRFSINQNEKVFYGCQLGAAPSSIEQTKL